MRGKAWILLACLSLLLAACDLDPSGGAPDAADWRILFASDLPILSTDLYVIDLDGTQYERLTDLTMQLQLRYAVGSDCSPDGRHIVFAARGIQRIDADGGHLTEILPPSSGRYQFPRWSPDGTRIAFNAWSFGSLNSELFVANADGSDVTRLTDNDFSDQYPSWSPDGTQIAFDFEDDGETGIAIIDADGTNLRELTRTSFRDGEPDWSPDGQTILFSSNRNGLYDLYTIRPDGSGLTQITRHSGNNRFPSWSPDGSLVSFSSDRDEDEFDYQIYVMNPDGSQPRRVTYAPFDWVANFNECWLVSPRSSDEGSVLEQIWLALFGWVR